MEIAIARPGYAGAGDCASHIEFSDRMRGMAPGIPRRMNIGIDTRSKKK